MSHPTPLSVSTQGPVTVLQITRPHRRNAIDSSLLDALAATLSDVERDDQVRAVVLTGDDQAFSSGQDLKEPEPSDYLDRFNEVVGQLERLPKPTVAAVSGWCIAGGLEFALGCDVRVASAESTIGDFHARINSIGGGGMTARLPRTVGLSRAKKLMFTSELLDAEEALRIGLVDAVHPVDAYLDAAIDLAGEAANHDPRTLAYAKQALHEGLELPLERAVERSLELHRALQDELADEPS